MMLSGRCLCGACSYEIEGEPLVVAHCYCNDCRRVTGAGHSTGAMFAESGVRLSGAPASYSLQNSAGNTVTRLFCAQCGSPLFGKNTGMPGFMTVMMGTLDSSERLVPQVAVFCRSRQHWDPEITTVQGFDAQPAWKPE